MKLSKATPSEELGEDAVTLLPEDPEDMVSIDVSAQGLAAGEPSTRG